MWEEEKKKKKGKTERLFSRGTLILVFLILAAQSIFFTRYLLRSSRMPPEETVAAVPDTVVAEPPVKKPEPQAEKPRKEKAPEPKTPEIIVPAKDTQKVTRPQYRHDGWNWDRVELNSADSAALDALPGIGPYYARQILAYRDRLGFYADISQLLDIRGFDTTRLNRLADRIYIDPASLHPLDLYTMSLDSMSAHPYIGPYAAKGLDRLRRTLPKEEFTFQAILDSNILPPAQARRLALYFKD